MIYVYHAFCLHIPYGPREIHHLDSTGVAVPSPSSEQGQCHAQAKGQIPMQPSGRPGPGQLTAENVAMNRSDMRRFVHGGFILPSGKLT